MTRDLFRLLLGLVVFVVGSTSAAGLPVEPVTERALGLSVAAIVGSWLVMTALARIWSSAARRCPATDSAGFAFNDRRSPRREPEAIARHEAAHAVAVLHLGHKLLEVSTVPSGMSGGRVAWEHRDQVLTSVDHVTIALIGPLAEGTGDLAGGSLCDSDDYVLALRTAIGASVLAGGLKPPSAVLDQGMERARQILTADAERINQLTAQLSSRVCLDGADVEALLVATLARSA